MVFQSDRLWESNATKVFEAKIWGSEAFKVSCCGFLRRARVLQFKLHASHLRLGDALQDLGWVKPG